MFHDAPARMAANIQSLIERFDKLEKGAVGVLEAEESGSGFVGETDRDWFRYHLDAVSLEPRVFLLDILGEQRYSGDPGMVKMGIRGSLGLRFLPFDKIDSGGMRVVAQP